MSIKSRKKHPIIKISGIAKYCHLNEPNKRFEPEFGEYNCDTVVTEDVARQIKEQLRPLYEEELKSMQEEKGGQKLKQADMPIKESDQEIMIRTKLKGGHRAKDGTVYNFSVALFDAAGKPLPKDVEVWGGSKVNVAVRPNFWYTDLMGFGVTFELQAVQVIELANGGQSAMAADAFGFTSEEGFVANGGETLDQVFDAEETSETEVTANF
jgi:hypothetical protein